MCVSLTKIPRAMPSTSATASLYQKYECVSSVCERETKRESERKRDREKKRQREKETERKRDREKKREIEKKRDREKREREKGTE
jgi:hypothetical protein